MKQLIAWLSGVLVLLAGAVHAQELIDVEGKRAIGLPGERVFVELSYNFGPSFDIIAEDFQLRYPAEVLTFVHEASQVVRRSHEQVLDGTDISPISLADYLQFLQSGAGSGFPALVLENDDPDSGIYNFSYAPFFGAEDRNGSLDMILAFDIGSSAVPGTYPIEFAAVSNLTTLDEREFGYPDLQQLQVTVVPEPEAALMLLPGLALIGWHVRRRRARQA